MKTLVVIKTEKMIILQVAIIDRITTRRDAKPNERRPQGKAHGYMLVSMPSVHRGIPSRYQKWGKGGSAALLRLTLDVIGLLTQATTKIRLGTQPSAKRSRNNIIRALSPSAQSKA